MRRVAAALMTCAVTALSHGQDLTPRGLAPEHPVAITGATIHTMVPGQAPIENGYVLFENGRIAEVGQGERMFIATTRIIDARGMHVYPGMIAAVTRLGLTEIASVRAMRDYNEVGEVKPEVRAVVAVNPDSTLLPVARTNGILLAGTFPSGGLVSGQAGVIRMDGWTWEDMTANANAGLVVNWPSVREGHSPFGGGRGLSEEQIRQRIAQIDQLFDTAQAYGSARLADRSTPIDVRLEAMLDVLPGALDQKPLIISANTVERIQSAVTWAAGRGLRVIIRGGRDAPMLAELLKRHDVAVIVEGVHNFPRRSDSDFDEAFTLPARLHAAGVRWCLAPGNIDENVRNLPYEAATAVAYGRQLGFDEAAAMAAITRDAARILGIGDHYGTLEVGKSATLLITDGTPLEMATTIEAAFLDGARVDLSNKQRVLRDRYREKYQRLGIIEGGD
ncbi:MAG: amidohydrolase family protein [Phycisphaeraceae bacterium]|nr:amidohydrolase family protein [Phycisphaeraceae bacterium]